MVVECGYFWFLKSPITMSVSLQYRMVLGYQTCSMDLNDVITNPVLHPTTSRRVVKICTASMLLDCPSDNTAKIRVMVFDNVLAASVWVP